MREQRFCLGQKSFVEGVECKKIAWRVHSARTLLICNFHTHIIEVDMEKIIKLGEMYMHLLFRVFEAAVKKLVAHASALG